MAIRCKINWNELENWERKAIQEALDFTERWGMEVVGVTVIHGMSPENWLKIGGWGYARDYEKYLTEEEKKRGKYIEPEVVNDVILWVVR